MSPKKPSTPRKSPAKPDRDPHKFSPGTKAPNATQRNDRDSSKRDRDRKRERADRSDLGDKRSGPSANRGPNKSTPKTSARPDSSAGQNSHGRPGDNKKNRSSETDRQSDRRDPPARILTPPSPRSPRGDTTPATPMDSPGLDGVDNNHDGIVDNENPFDELPPIEIPIPRGGGLPGFGGPKGAPSAPKAPKPAEPAPKQSAPGDNDRTDRGDGRDTRGRYSKGNDGRSGKEAEKRELDNLEKRTGTPIIRDQKRASIDGVPRGRYYDGLMPNGDGTYSGIEVKSGGATKDAWQKKFDDMVSPERPAQVTLPDGTKVKITNVIDIKAPE